MSINLSSRSFCGGLHQKSLCAAALFFIPIIIGRKFCFLGKIVPKQSVKSKALQRNFPKESCLVTGFCKTKFLGSFPCQKTENERKSSFFNHFITLKRTRVSKNDFLESGPEDFVENATLTTTVTIKYSGNNATFSSLPTGVSVSCNGTDQVMTIK